MKLYTITVLKVERKYHNFTVNATSENLAIQEALRLQKLMDWSSKPAIFSWAEIVDDKPRIRETNTYKTQD